MSESIIPERPEATIAHLKRSMEGLQLLLTILAQRLGGEVRVTEAELRTVDRRGGLSVCDDKVTGERVVRVLTAEDVARMRSEALRRIVVPG